MAADPIGYENSSGAPATPMLSHVRLPVALLTLVTLPRDKGLCFLLRHVLACIHAYAAQLFMPYGQPPSGDVIQGLHWNPMQCCPLLLINGILNTPQFSSLPITQRLGHNFPALYSGYKGSIGCPALFTYTRNSETSWQ